VDAPRPAAGVRRTDLEEQLQQARRALAQREEAPSGDWVVETARELHSGSKPGWFLSDGGVAFYARRGPAAFGHVHAGGGAPTVAAVRLAETVLDALPTDIASINLGFSGLTAEGERQVVARLLGRPGSRAIGRQAMEHPLTAEDERPPPGLPTGTRELPVREITLEALTDLDVRAFRGSPDELLIGASPAEYRYVLDTILAGQLGRFVDEASTALVEESPVRLVGAVLTAEQTIRRATLVDLLVDPERRRRGLGRFLVEWSLRALRGLGYETARLWVTDDNRPALALYAHYGFRPVAAATIYRWERPSGPQPHTAR